MTKEMLLRFDEIISDQVKLRIRWQRWLNRFTVGNKNATEQKLGEVSSDLDLLRYGEAKNSSV